MTRMHLRPLLLCFAIVLLDCATLDPLSANTCGNGVVDANEDCDSFPSQQCGTPSDGAAQCRLLCNRTVKDKDGKDVQLTCPDGWGCSVSNFCRAPSGGFQPSDAPFSSGVTHMSVGDFDGDRRADILGTNAGVGRGRIHYVNVGAEPQIVSLPGVLAAPTVFDFDGDGRSDIAFGYSGPRDLNLVDDIPGTISQSDGLALILGQTDRTIVPKLFPSLSGPSVDPFIIPLVAVRGDVPKNGSPIVSLALLPGDGGRRSLISLDNTSAAQGTLPSFHRILDGTVAGDPQSGKLFVYPPMPPPPTSACGEVVIGLNGGAAGSRVEVYSPCQRGALTVTWAQNLPPVVIPMPAPVTRVFIADVDGDGSNDLIIGTTGTPSVYVAYGDGGASFTPVAAPTTLTDVPLAAGLINFDRVIDFVVPGGVLISGTDLLDGGLGGDGGLPPLPTRDKLAWSLLRSPNKTWTVAQIADVNRDSAPDVIAASRAEADIDVLEGTLTHTMPAFTVSTTGPVTNLVASDFDFDGTQDIAFAATNPASTVLDIGVSYGRVLTMPPEDPRTAGRLDGVRQLFLQPNGIAISSVTKDAFSLAVLLKSTERQPIAPLLFEVTDTKKAIPILATRSLVAARRGANVDLIAFLAITDVSAAVLNVKKKLTYGVWAAAGTGPASFDSPQQGLTLDGLPVADSSDRFLVRNAAGDLGDPAGWNIVVVSPNDAGPGTAIRIIPPGGPKGNGMPATTIPGIAVLPPPIVLADREPYVDARIELRDVDGDGHLDLVTLLEDVVTKAPILSVLFGTGKSTFEAPAVTIAIPAITGATPDELVPLAFTQMTTRGAPLGDVSGPTLATTSGKRREVMILTKSRLFRASFDGTRKATVSEAPEIFGKISEGVAIVTGDFDGDGVQDLAISDQSAIRIARQKAVLP